ncbi:surfactin synthase thioesterase subunit [Paenibacillus sp. DS2015]|uniref:thioesterase II family protein n=1 Tax=Paenibacillus sp. DS2015 TaxID=3373917 RepID=UPI003D24E84C
MKPNVIYCLPHAGGSAYAFNSWNNYLNESIECIPIEYPGRGKRHNDPPYMDIQEAVGDIYRQIKETLRGRKYMIFGHSMGGLFTYEVVRKINELHVRQPIHVFISGKGAPLHTKEPELYEHILSDESFVNRIIKLGGTPQEITDNKELLYYFLPMIRNDYRIVETYQYKESEPVKNNVTILYGADDNLLSGNIEDWNLFFSGKVHYLKFEGGHFFNQAHEKEIVGVINSMFEDHLE